MLDNSRLYYMKLYWKQPVFSLSNNIDIWNERMTWFNMYDSYLEFTNLVKLEYNNNYDLIDYDVKNFLTGLFNILSKNKNYLQFLSFYPKTYKYVRLESANYKNINWNIPHKFLCIDLKKCLFQIYKENNINLYEIYDSLTDKTIIKNSILYILLFSNYVRVNTIINGAGRWYPYYNYCKNFEYLTCDNLWWHMYSAEILWSIYNSNNELFKYLKSIKAPYLIKGDHIEYLIDDCFDEVKKYILSDIITVNNHTCHITLSELHSIKYSIIKNGNSIEDTISVYYDVLTQSYANNIIQITGSYNYYVPQFWKILNDEIIEERDLYTLDIEYNQISSEDKINQKITVLNISK